MKMKIYFCVFICLGISLWFSRCCENNYKLALYQAYSCKQKYLSS